MSPNCKPANVATVLSCNHTIVVFVLAINNCKHAIVAAFLFYRHAIIAAILSINDKHTLLVNMPTISPFGIDGNPKQLR